MLVQKLLQKYFHWHIHLMSDTSASDSKNMQDLLNQTGPGFCLAKWSQVTMHLGNGLTHSCHHPIPHKISLEELSQNPTALHNTEHKKQQRKDMLNGKRPKECDFCWRVEDNGEISDRALKSMQPWSSVDYDKIKELIDSEKSESSTKYAIVLKVKSGSPPVTVPMRSSPFKV